jgi:hypothetical protein
MKRFLTHFKTIFGIFLISAFGQFFILEVILDFGATAFAQQVKVTKKVTKKVKVGKNVVKKIIKKRIVKKVVGKGVKKQISALQNQVNQLEQTVDQIDLKTGPKGDTGEQGIPGTPGAKGDTGDTGLTGEQGIPGTPGAKGDTGDTGLKGDTGDVGPKGDTGLTGDAGPKGDSGDQGIPGTPGAKGDTGDTGLKGDTGDVGPKGDTGLTGEQGLPGTPGAKGDTGDTGLKGDTGDTGQTGQQGIPGTPGAKGDTGDTGLTGDAGPKGDTGDTGQTGEQGIPGTPGAKGDTGDIGPVGLKGDQGEIGPQGEQGPEGISGKDNVDGVRIIFARKIEYAGPSGNVDSVDLNGTNLYIDGNDPTITLSGVPLTILYKGVISSTSNQQVIAQLPSGVLDGNHAVELDNSNGDSSFNLALGFSSAQQSASSATSEPSTEPAGPEGSTESSGSTTGSTGGVSGPAGDTGISGIEGTSSGASIITTEVESPFNTTVLLNSLRIGKSLSLPAFTVLNGKVDSFMDESGIEFATYGDGSTGHIVEPGVLDSTLGQTLTLQSKTIIANKVPTRAHLVLLKQDVDIIELNSDLRGFVSRDGGVTWAEIIFSDVGKFDDSTRIIVGTHPFSGEPAGTLMKYSITSNSKKLKLKGVALEWK